MSDKDFILTSGAKLHVSTASFDNANSLIKALARCAKGLQLKDDILKTDLAVMKDYLVEAVSSEDVERALFACMKKASYENVSVDKSLFDDPKLGDQARQDYFEICSKIIEVNSGPFFVKIFSQLKERMTTAPAIPKSA